MAITKTTGKNKRNAKNQVSKKNPKKETVSEIVMERKVSDDSDANVSVFTKTTTPKVVIQSEKMDNLNIHQNICKHRMIKSIYLIVMGIIVLMTFFLSLKTYQTVNELYRLFTF